MKHLDFVNYQDQWQSQRLHPVSYTHLTLPTNREVQMAQQVHIKATMMQKTWKMVPGTAALTQAAIRLPWAHGDILCVLTGLAWRNVPLQPSTPVVRRGSTGLPTDEGYKSKSWSWRIKHRDFVNCQDQWKSQRLHHVGSHEMNRYAMILGPLHYAKFYHQGSSMETVSRLPSHELAQELLL